MFVLTYNLGYILIKFFNIFPSKLQEKYVTSHIPTFSPTLQRDMQIFKHSFSMLITHLLGTRCQYRDMSND